MPITPPAAATSYRQFTPCAYFGPPGWAARPAKGGAHARFYDGRGTVRQRPPSLPPSVEGGAARRRRKECHPPSLVLAPLRGELAPHFPVGSTVSACGLPSIYPGAKSLATLGCAEYSAAAPSVTSFTGSSFPEARFLWAEGGPTYSRWFSRGPFLWAEGGSEADSRAAASVRRPTAAKRRLLGRGRGVSPIRQQIANLRVKPLPPVCALGTSPLRGGKKIGRRSRRPIGRPL